jgi:shikimate dehydrogenase
MSMSGRAKVAGVMGWSVAHSLSPQLYGFWLREHGIDGAYIPLAVARESFATAIRGLRTAGLAGVSVTNPHKEAALALADTLDEAAKSAGAANLLLFCEGRVDARNTDIAGLKASLVESLGAGALKGKAAVVLGAGGAARGAVLALSDMGALEIRVVARNTARAEALIANLRPSSNARLEPMSWPDWPRAAKGIALLVNATSAGLAGAAALDLSLDPLPNSAAICDIVYNPLETQLLKDARARGHRTVDGLGMLMHQAVPAFAAFYGVTPRVTSALRSELEKALRHGR